MHRRRLTSTLIRPKPSSMERPLEPKRTQAAPAPTTASLPTCSSLCPQDVYTCMLASSPASQGTADKWCQALLYVEAFLEP